MNVGNMAERSSTPLIREHEVGSTPTVTTMNTKDKGDISEAAILAKLVKSGKTVLTPWGDNKRYDLAIDNGGKLERIQCKTGHINKGCIVFHTSSCATGRGGDIKCKSYRGDADKFAVYCPENDKTYIIPVSECGVSHCSLRLDEPLGGNKKYIKWAKNYEYE